MDYVVVKGYWRRRQALQHLDQSNSTIGTISNIKFSKIGNKVTCHNQLYNIDYAYFQPRDNAGVDQILSYTIVEAKNSVLELCFYKLLVSANYNGTSVLFLPNMNPFESNPHIVKMILEITIEVILVACA